MCEDTCSCSHKMMPFITGALIGLGTGVLIGVNLCPSPKKVKKMAKKTKSTVSEAMDHLKDSLEMYI